MNGPQRGSGLQPGRTALTARKATSPSENSLINLLRLLAALLVVAEHLRGLMFVDFTESSKGPGEMAFYAISGLGHASVMVFFVLSGYWVGGSVIDQTRTGRFAIREYLIRRSVRLWVVLLPALLLTGILDLIGSKTLQSAVYEGSTAYHNIVPTDLAEHQSIVTLIGNLAFLQGLRVPTFGTNGALWSLAYEFWYYILFPLIWGLFTVRNLKHRAFMGALALSIALLIGEEALSYFAVWLIGVAASAFTPYATKAAPMLTNPICQISFAVLLLGAMLCSTALSYPQYLLDLLVGFVAGVILISFSKDAEKNRLPGKLLDTASRGANFSYSMYAIHVPVVVLITAAVVPNPEDRWQIGGTSALWAATILLSVVAMSYLFYSVTEKRTPLVRGLVSRRLAR